MLGGALMAALPGGLPMNTPWYHRAPLWEMTEGSHGASAQHSAASADVLFLPPPTIPFGQLNLGVDGPNLVDLDDDGDLDAFFVGIGRVSNAFILENTGSRERPLYTRVNPEVKFGFPSGLTADGMTFADLDGDGDQDAIAWDFQKRARFIENTGSASTPAFAASGSFPNGPTFSIDIGSLSVVDLDGDDDLDAMITDPAGNVRYSQNTGTRLAPAFADLADNPFGLPMELPGGLSFADIDADGDLDAFSAESEEIVTYFENTGTIKQPTFAAARSDQFGLIDVGSKYAPEFYDFDGDGDLDAFFTDELRKIYFENIGTKAAPEFKAPTGNPFGLSDISYDPKTEFADIDADGDLDLFVVGLRRDLFYLENLGNANRPIFGDPITSPFGLPAANGDDAFIGELSLVDIDGDGDLDAFLAVRQPEDAFLGLHYYENTGSREHPSFATAQFEPFGFSGQFVPPELTFVDIDSDGDFDAFSGSPFFETAFYENTGSPRDPSFAQLRWSPFGLSRRFFGHSEFADLDQDGDLDMFIWISPIVGLNYFENTGSKSSPEFVRTAINPFGLSGIENTGSASFADIDGDGDLDAFIERASTKPIHFFENITGQQPGESNREQSIAVSQNFPNPFDTSTEIVYALSQPGHVRLIVYDVQGREVARLVDREQGAGEYHIPWSAGALPSGLYVYRLEAGDKTEVRTMMLVR